jgi:glycine oxidase
VTDQVIVVGGGLIGLATAWRAAQAGLEVTLVDPAPGSGASHVAAGLLAPVTEVHYGEEELLRCNIAGARRWPGFAAALEEATGHEVGYQQGGTLLVGFDADDHRVLDELHRFQEELGLDVDRLRSRDCRTREPMLTPRIRGGLFARGDHHVDPRKVTAALVDACRAAGVRFVPGEVARVEHDGHRVTGVGLHDGGHVDARQIVLAAGAAAAGIDGLEPSLVLPVRPVKGQILRLRSRDGYQLLSVAVRGIVQGRNIYLVPRRDGEVVVGATQEELGHDTAVTAGGVRELLDAAAAIVPGIDELTLAETSAGLRPGTPDNRPLIGGTSLGGLVLATGHHRNGVLLTPITADAVVALLVGDEPPGEVAVADPRRAGIRPGGGADDARRSW